MKKICIALILLCCPLLVTAETFVNRARVVMARVKNDSSPLDSKVPPAIAVKYADAFILVYRKDLLTDFDGNVIDIATISNEVKGQVYINQLRAFHRDVLSASRIPLVAREATNAEKARVKTESQADLGDVE